MHHAAASAETPRNAPKEAGRRAFIKLLCEKRKRPPDLKPSSSQSTSLSAAHRRSRSRVGSLIMSPRTAPSNHGESCTKTRADGRQRSATSPSWAARNGCSPLVSGVSKIPQRRFSRRCRGRDFEACSCAASKLTASREVALRPQSTCFACPPPRRSREWPYSRFGH